MTITLSFNGPKLSEHANTFFNYRLDVTFRNNAGDTIVVPGYFAADGNAANTGATSGSVWRVHFNPPSAGDWRYEVGFRTGKDVATNGPSSGESAGFMDGKTGAFKVASSAVANTIQYDGDHYASFSHTNETYLKFGSGSPENILAYKGFDNTPKASKTWAAHASDWNAGDPSWAGGKGKEIIGAFNYLAERGATSQYFVLNTAGGDGRDLWPWVSPKFGDLPTKIGATLPAAATAADLMDARVYDVSKLAQWAIALEHADRIGLTSHIFFAENENDRLLNNGSLGAEQKVYYREMVARLGHLDKVIWTVGEETTLSTQQIKASAAYIKQLDPYDHLVTVHTWPTKFDIYKGLLGDRNIDGMSIQAGSRDYTLNTGRDNLQDASDAVAYWKKASAAAGRPWVMFWDETGPAADGVLPDNAKATAGEIDANHRAMRGEAVQALFAGASGFEWYFGYKHPESDISANTFKNRATLWTWNKALRDFAEGFPIDKMSPTPAVATGNDIAAGKAGDVYAIYTPDGGAVKVDLRGEPGAFIARWYDPRNGGFKGEARTIEGDKVVDIGGPPNNASKDWLVVIEKSAGARAAGVPDASLSSPFPSPPTADVPLIGTRDADILVFIENARTGARVIEVGDDAAIDRSAFGSDVFRFVVQANPTGRLDGKVGSMRLDFEDGMAVKIDDAAPFTALDGGLTLGRGFYDLDIESFAEDGAKGALLDVHKLDFEVL